MENRATLSLAFLLALVTTAPAKIPSYRGKFNSLPCLAPYIRQMDPDAPKSIEEAMLLPPYQAAYLMEHLGEVSFPITVVDPALQPFFDQGVAQLHTMWFTEAERSFRQVAAADPDCAMAYWGLALANERYPKRAAIYMEQAFTRLSKEPGVTPKEREWLTIYNDYWNPHANPVAEGEIPTDDAVLRARRNRALEAFIYKFPEDLEARAFLLRHLVVDELRSGAVLANHFLVDLLAEEIFGKNPAHPSRDYRAFLWLDENPAHALDTATQITGISSGVPDAWRYAAQIYRAAGKYQAALFYQDAALRVAHRYMMRNLIMPDDMENLAANYAAHVDTLCSMGRLEDAVAASRRLIAMPRTAYLGEKDTLKQKLDGCHSTGKRLLFQTLLRHERWREIIDEAEGGHLRSGDGGAPVEAGAGAKVDWDGRAHAIYWKAIARFNLEGPEAAAEDIAELDALFGKFRVEGTTNEVKAEIVRCIRGLRTYRDLFTKSTATLPDLESNPLPYITDDHLARLLFHAGLYDDALALAARDREARPGQLLSTANFCDLYTRDGKRDQALAFFDSQFRRDATLADPGLILFDRVQPMIKALNLRGNWKLPPLAALDESALPDPDSLGPAAWSPPEAPAWSLPDHTGSAISLESFRGKPVLINFFLGVGCVFCVEQLKAFAPHVEAFEEAGISMIAVSTDSVEVLEKSIGGAIKENGKAPYPFPIVSDESRDVFKSYRAWSDFEESGMHGSALIGPEGRILWLDVSHEPFMFPEFLLEEAKRLLGGR